MGAPKQITIRGPSPDLSRRLKTISKARGVSVNTTILRLLEDAVGVDARRDRLLKAANWTEEEARQFDTELRAMRTIDDKAWR